IRRGVQVIRDLEEKGEVLDPPLQRLVQAAKAGDFIHHDDPYPPGWVRCQFHALSTIDPSDGWRGVQPRRSCARAALATRVAGSPARRGPSCTGKLRPATRSTSRITSRTE